MEKLPETFTDFAAKKVWVNYTSSKIPINPKTLHNAMSSKASTWSDYQTAAANIGETASVKIGKGQSAEIRDETILGVGLIIGEQSGISAIDLDDVISDNGSVDDDAIRIINLMDSYTEISMSGHGIHILYTGQSPVKGAKVNVSGKSREMYGSGRYIAITGNVYGNHSHIESRTRAAKSIFDNYIVPYIQKPKQSRSERQKATYKASNSNPAIEAIRKHDYQYFRDVLKEKRRTFINSEELFSFIYRYPLNRFLGVEADSAFCCFFHEDTNPSAVVYKGSPETGSKWLYHCHAEDMTLTLKTIVEKVGDFDSEIDSIEFIEKCLNCELPDTKWSRRQQKTIDLVLDRMSRTDQESFSALCPTADKNINFGKSLYLQILILAKGTVFPSKYNLSGNVIFYMSLAQLCRESGRGSTDKILKWIKVFQYHGLLQALPDDQIPKNALEKAKRQAGEGHRHIQFYCISSMVIKRLEAIEQQGRKWKQYGYTRKGISYEMFFRTEGPAVANSLYPQRYKGTGTFETMGEKANQKAEHRHERVHEIAMDLLRKHGYFTEKMILQEYGAKYWSQAQIKRSMADICNMYGLTRRKATKALKTRYSIESEGYPIIYYLE